jgi:hypothetical protein
MKEIHKYYQYNELRHGSFAGINEEQIATTPFWHWVVAPLLQKLSRLFGNPLPPPFWSSPMCARWLDQFLVFVCVSPLGSLSKSWFATV